MTTPRPHDSAPSRLDELLADRALAGLTPAEQAELAELLQGEEDESFDLAAAALDLALTGPDAAPPARLMDTLRAAAPIAAAPQAHAPAPVAGRIRPLPWLIAAASIALAFASWFLPIEASPAQRRAALLAQTPQATLTSWQALDDPSAAAFVEGDVVWNDERQEGYMRFVGLNPNNPDAEQYQLWIFDESRSADHPVDGGVFNVTSAGEIIVPINAKIPVTRATMFAITIERPGGVVVSDRSRLPLLAQVAKG